MGGGSVRGRVSDYYKKRGQATHGEGAKRRRLSNEGAERREAMRRERRAGNPARG